MSFDARSRERLEALGRQLPRPLPLPTRGDTAGPGRGTGSPTPLAATDPQARDPKDPRHRIETETDPEALFHELMQVSPDGTVPPHLLERLRHLEADRRRPPAPVATDAAAKTAAKAAVKTAPLRPSSLKPPGRPGGDQDLYTAFQQMLLEDDDLA